MKRFLYLIMLFLLLTSLFSACAAPPSSPEPIKQEAESEVKAPEAESEVKAPEAKPEVKEEATKEEVKPPKEAKKQIKWLTLDWKTDEFKKQFEADNPGYELVIENLPFNDLFQQIQIRMGAKSDSFDVFSVDVPVTSGYGLRGWLLPLDDIYTVEEKADWLDSALSAGTFDGKLVSAPVSTSTQLLYYNQDLLEKAGIPLPDKDERLTYEKVAELAKKIAQDEDKDGTPDVWGFSWEQTVRIYQLGQMPASLGGKMIGDDGLTVDGIINDKAWVDAFSFYQKTFTEWKLGPQSDTVPTIDLFMAGKMGFIVAGPWNIRRFMDGNLPFKWGVSRTPYFEKGVPTTPTGSWHIGINPNSKNIDAAKVFVHYISTGKGAEYWWRIGSNDFPAQKSILKLFATDKQFDEPPLLYMRTAADEATVNPIPRAVTPGYLEYEQILQNTFQDIRQGSDVKESLDKAVERISSEMEKYKR